MANRRMAKIRRSRRQHHGSKSAGASRRNENGNSAEKRSAENARIGGALGESDMAMAIIWRLNGVMAKTAMKTCINGGCNGVMAS